MSASMDRRQFLTTAAIAGATIVGASSLGALDADAAFAAPTPSLDPGIAKSAFVEGVIGAIQGSMLHIASSDGTTHRVQVTNATSVWKLRPTNAGAIEVGDGMYGRGVRMPDGSVAADAIWVNIVNLYCTIDDIGRDRLQLRHNSDTLVGNVVGGTTAASYNGAALTADLSRLRIGQSAQVLGAWRPADGAVDIARLSIGH
ncbi:MAG: twin-arginine translocation signal domain-containing protein [Mycobacteriales bacterium]